MRRTIASLIVSLSVAGCSTRHQETKTVQRQTAADEILRIAHVWTATLPEQGLLSPPSPITLFKNSRNSRVELSATSGRETLVIDEMLQLRSGEEVRCSTSVTHDLQIKYGRRGEEAAVEVIRPALSSARSCTGIHPDGPLNEGEKRALFVLRADTLVAVDPPLEKRKYLPEAN